MTIAGALERRVWVKAFGMKLYPNMFIVLVGGPGVGKTVAIRQTEYFWRGIEDLVVAPDSVTRASIIDDLYAAKRRVLVPGGNPPFIEFHSLQCAAEEFGVFIPAYDNEFINTLNKIYDCGPQYAESRRSNKGDPKRFPNPQLSIIGGTTPSWLKDSLPDGAWQQGFTSRILLVYSHEAIPMDPWNIPETNERTKIALENDLNQIFSVYGQLSFEDAAADAFRNWYMGGRMPVPDHPKLEHYLPRRHTHLLKLCIVISLSHSNNMVITLRDYQEALDTLLEVEAYMPDVFKAMVTGSDKNTYDEAFRFAWEISKGGTVPFPEHRLVYWLAQRVPVYTVKPLIETMINSHILEIRGIGGEGHRELCPSSPEKKN